MSIEQARRELQEQLRSTLTRWADCVPVTAAIEALIDAKLAQIAERGYISEKTPPVIGFPEYGTNQGHGHVWERPDGVRTHCGGPGLCKLCSLDELRALISFVLSASPAFSNEGVTP